MIAYPVDGPTQTVVQRDGRLPAQDFLRQRIIGDQPFNFAGFRPGSLFFLPDFNGLSDDLDDSLRHILDADLGTGSDVDRLTNRLLRLGASNESINRVGHVVEVSRRMKASKTHDVARETLRNDCR